VSPDEVKMRRKGADPAVKAAKKSFKEHKISKQI
jgi:hypothetical protein